jgi:CheY-like chemotaxis protein
MQNQDAGQTVSREQQSAAGIDSSASPPIPANDITRPVARQPDDERELLECDVLVVEDDDLIREQLADILRDEGYTVVTAANGQEALDRLEDLDAGLVILDLMMPVMSGWELARALRRMPGVSDTPLLVITAATYAARAPLGPVFVKPLNLDSLLRAVHLHLGQRC